MLQQQSNKIKLPSKADFQPQFKFVIEDTCKQLSQFLKEKLHSIYLYGSVANGYAIESNR